MRTVLLVLAVVASALGACGDDSSGDGPRVVASFYPVAYAVARVAAELVGGVHNLTPAGVEPHDLELDSDDIDRIESADLVLYVGSGFQPAIETAAKRGDGAVVDVSRGLLRAGKDDPHFWLDPTLMSQAVDRIEEAVSKTNPREREKYEHSATAFKQELADLDRDFSSTLSQCKRKTIVTAHAAFSYLADRYGLTQRAISGIDPESEPDPGKLADLTDLIRREDITTVFYEELVPRDFADTLAREAGVRTAVLNPLEGLSKDEEDDGDTYLTVMRRNLSTLATALDCRP